MALQARSPAKHNEMLGKFLKQELSMKKHQEIGQRPAKRAKRSQSDDDAHGESLSDSTPSSPKTRPRRIPDSDVDSDDEILDEPTSSQRTDLESALPVIKDDKKAIEEYEAQKVTDSADLDLRDRLSKAEWVKGRTSIYVDAFNLALTTVLEEESHLFDAAEMKVFEEWKALSYEAQYL